jgi:hypothetical protein
MGTHASVTELRKVTEAVLAKAWNNESDNVGMTEWNECKYEVK